jgi:ABC-type branched-subunit amino acid transport system ATPase component
MSLAETIFEGPSESRQDLKVTTLLLGRNCKKNLRIAEFQIRRRRGRFSACAQDVDSMSDSQIRDLTVALVNGGDHVFEQIK